MARLARIALTLLLVVRSFATPVLASPIAGYPDFEIVESAPIETSLDHPDIRNAHEVWLEMIRGAKKTLDFAEFYASSEPGEPLEDVIEAMAVAAKRGVAVRFFCDKRFTETYPETFERLTHLGPRCEALPYDFKPVGGGVHHAKYFIVDGGEVYLGSQNFDWRSLKHIQEMGVRVRDPEFAGAMTDLYNSDFRTLYAQNDPGANLQYTIKGRIEVPITHVEAPGESLVFTPVMSPRGWIPDSTLWDEPRLVAMIDSAKTAVSVQVLTYNPVSHGDYYDVLETALRRAAARGVHVRLIVSDWCKRKSTIPYIKSLALVPNIEVRLMTIPPWSGGFVPYARVVHAKYMVVDDRAAWVGTSNWEKDYFHASRNVGVIVTSARINGILARFFEDNWTSPYAYAVDPAADYAPPKIGE